VGTAWDWQLRIRAPGRSRNRAAPVRGIERRLSDLVAQNGSGGVLGNAYARPYRTRPGYRFACEDSVYVASAVERRGIGRAPLEALIRRCEAAGLRLLAGVIGESGNDASIGLHRALGFAHAGVLPIGWKSGRWVDTVFMMRPLGGGMTSPPEHPVPVGQSA
jgi:phosphinothricin acetyltransferase